MDSGPSSASLLDAGTAPAVPWSLAAAAACALQCGGRCGQVRTSAGDEAGDDQSAGGAKNDRQRDTPTTASPTG